MAGPAVHVDEQQLRATVYLPDATFTLTLPQLRRLRLDHDQAYWQLGRAHAAGFDRAAADREA